MGSLGSGRTTTTSKGRLAAGARHRWIVADCCCGTSRPGAPGDERTPQARNPSGAGCTLRGATALRSKPGSEGISPQSVDLPRTRSLFCPYKTLKTVFSAQRTVAVQVVALHNREPGMAASGYPSRERPHHCAVRGTYLAVLTKEGDGTRVLFSFFNPICKCPQRSPAQQKNLAGPMFRAQAPASWSLTTRKYFF